MRLLKLLLLVTLILLLTSCDEINQPIAEKDLSPVELYQKKVDPNEHHCLSLNIYHEARNDNLAGMVATADVVLNRVNDTRYPNDICAVVYQSQVWESGIPKKHKCQFSWYCDGLSDEPRAGISWEKSKKIAENLLLNDTHRGLTEGATHYHAHYVKPYWAIDDGMHLVGTIGEHIFYRWDK